MGVQFRIDENGMLEVLARDTATGKDTVVRIESAAVDVDDGAVGEMVGASVEHAFEDMAERIFTEARMKAEELLPAGVFVPACAAFFAGAALLLWAPSVFAAGALSWPRPVTAAAAALYRLGAPRIWNDGRWARSILAGWPRIPGPTPWRSFDSRVECFWRSRTA